MALVNCISCDFQISDSAVACPKCETVQQKVEKKRCPECNVEINDESSAACTECGFPFSNSNDDLLSPPDDHVSLEEFSKIKGIEPEKIINMVRDGFYQGTKVNEKWYIRNEPSTNTLKSKSSLGRGLGKIEMISPSKKELAYVRTGFDWPAFWSLTLAGIPFFLRGMVTHAWICVGINILVLFMMYGTGSSSDEVAGMSFILTLMAIGVAVYFGKKGGEYHAKTLLEKGYEFSNDQSEIVKLCKDKWGLV